jgi:hypothetical protein
LRFRGRGPGMMPLPVVSHVLLLLVACHVFLHSRRYVPRVVLRYASAGVDAVPGLPYCAKAGGDMSSAAIIIPGTVNLM